MVKTAGDLNAPAGRCLFGSLPDGSEPVIDQVPSDATLIGSITLAPAKASPRHTLSVSPSLPHSWQPSHQTTRRHSARWLTWQKVSQVTEESWDDETVNDVG